MYFHIYGWPSCNFRRWVSECAFQNDGHGSGVVDVVQSYSVMQHRSEIRNLELRCVIIELYWGQNEPCFRTRRAREGFFKISFCWTSSGKSLLLDWTCKPHISMDLPLIDLLDLLQNFESHEFHFESAYSKWRNHRLEENFATFTSVTAIACILFHILYNIYIYIVSV